MCSGTEQEGILMSFMAPFYENRKTLADTIIKNLEKRNMYGCYCATIAEAKEKALSFVKPGDSVGFGGSMSFMDSGVYQALKDRDDITMYDRGDYPPEEQYDVLRKCFYADHYFMSTNAIAIDGQMVNIDGSGNRVACLIFGPKHVIMLVGMNKVAPTIEDAVRRAREIASPPNNVRIGLPNPCTKIGRCADCLSETCICNQFVITRRSKDKDRIKVILVGEDLGY